MTPPIRREAAGHFSPAVFLFPKTSIPVRQQLGPRLSQHKRPGLEHLHPLSDTLKYRRISKTGAQESGISCLKSYPSQRQSAG